MRTTAGRDWQALIMGDGPGNEGTGTPGSGDYAPADYMGLSANADAEDAGNTTLPGEVGGGTLARTQATFAHTTGTDNYTLTHTFTSDQEIAIAKAGIFNAAAGGTLVFEKLLEDVADMVSGDQVAITVTVTI